MSVAMSRSMPRKSDLGATPTAQPLELLSVSEVSRLLRLSRRTIERLAGRGILPYYQLPVRGGLRFDRAAVLLWLASRHRESLGAK